ncbi:SDR family NAD(P)-dependent oxidoreductase [Sorangium sp. So ce1036]|uniref:SDR family NAD(P)-dependent oxidoreductase n=1 Tax=Sorangium sp. So ce1036 TaxID=3133328 RepID=UPI003F038AAE
MAITRIDARRFGPWALVTGASSGIGAELARQLAESGIHVVLAARSRDALAVVGGELSERYGVQQRVVAIDLATEGAGRRLAEACADLDVGLVACNAGVASPGELLLQAEDELLRCVRLKVATNLELVRAFGPRLVQRGRGGLLLVSSMGGLQGVPFVANNAATEAYVLSLGEGLHHELAPQGVFVTVLMPGPTDTPALARMGGAADMPIAPMAVDRCVAEGLAALAANRATHVAGRANRWMSALLPRRAATALMGRTVGRRFAAGALAAERARAVLGAGGGSP